MPVIVARSDPLTWRRCLSFGSQISPTAAIQPPSIRCLRSLGCRGCSSWVLTRIRSSLQHWVNLTDLICIIRANQRLRMVRRVPGCRCVAQDPFSASFWLFRRLKPHALSLGLICKEFGLFVTLCCHYVRLGVKADPAGPALC